MGVRRSPHWSQLNFTLSHTLFQPNLGRVNLYSFLRGFFATMEHAIYPIAYNFVVVCADTFDS